MFTSLPPKITKRNGNTRSSRRRRGRSNLRALLLLLLITLCSCYMAYNIRFYKYFTIKQVKLEQTTYISSAYLDSLCAELFLGANTMSSLSSQRKTIEREPLIKTVRFLRRFPDHLTVRVQEREPVALVYTDHFMEIDDEGMVLAEGWQTEELDLPIITGLSNRFLNKGKLSDDNNLRNALETLRICKLWGGAFADNISEIKSSLGFVQGGFFTF